MAYIPFIVVVWILMVGLYGIVTSRDLIHLIICLIVVQSSTYVLLLGVGYVTGAVAPYFYDVPVHTPAVDPVVQALALTDVVVEAAVTALRHPGPPRTRVAEGIAVRGRRTRVAEGIATGGPAARARRGGAAARGRRDLGGRAAVRPRPPGP
jgi:multicomponent Na+:H+ antiporter subunit C